MAVGNFLGPWPLANFVTLLFQAVTMRDWRGHFSRISIASAARKTTITQSESVGGQAQAGSRFFDVRIQRSTAR